MIVTDNLDILYEDDLEDDINTNPCISNENTNLLEEEYREKMLEIKIQKMILKDRIDFLENLSNKLK